MTWVAGATPQLLQIRGIAPAKQIPTSPQKPLNHAMELKLSFNNDSRTLPGVRALVENTLVELPLAQHAKSITDLVAAAVKHAIENAYPTGESGQIKLTVHENAGRLEIRVRDYGLPQNIAALEANLHNAESTADWLLQNHDHQSVDEMHWLAFGPEGKALQLIKWLHGEHVTDLSSPSDLVKASQDVPLAPQQEYTVRRMLAEEAVQVSQLMYRTYGNTYFNEDVYYPARIAELNAKGVLISIVAVSEDERIVGHCALERNRTGPVAEIGQAAVDPAHRSRGLLDKMKAKLEEEASSLDLVAWYADAVTVHTFTQQSNAKHGGHVCGVDLAVSPKTEAFRNINSSLTQRVSCVVYTHWLTDPQPQIAYVPERHRPIVTEIYANLGCPVTFGKAATPTQPHGKHTATLENRAGVATISVSEIGGDSALTIRHAVRDLVERAHAEVVLVELPLNEPATLGLCEELEKAGIGFTGIGPRFSLTGDVLKLAYLVEPLAREPIQTFEPFADRIVNYALDEQSRTRASL